MKKLSLVTVLALMLGLILFVLSSCSEEYEPVASTEEEARVVMTLKIENKTYDVKYELYRALFLSNKSEVDGGNDDVWSGNDKNEYISKINAIIIEKAADIYSVIHTATELGVDIYSKEFDDAVSEYIKINVEGNGSSIKGHGSYESYLAALKDMNMNYSVSDLMLRYSLALDKINEYYFGKVVDEITGETEGGVSVSDDDISAFYYGNESTRILSGYWQKGTSVSVSEIRNMLAAESDTDMIAALMVIHSTATSSELHNNQNPAGEKAVGSVIGKYSLNDLYYKEYTDAAFSLSHGEVSHPIELTGTGDSLNEGYYILCGLEKSDYYFENNKSMVKTAYLDNLIGKQLYLAEDALVKSAQATDNYNSIIHSDITME